MQDHLPLSAESFVWVLGSICRFNSIPFNSSLLLGEFPPPYSVATLKRAAASLGLRVALRRIKPSSLAQSQLPCVALLNETSSPSTLAPAGSKPGRDAVGIEPTSPLMGEGRGEGERVQPTRVALIVKADPQRVLYFEAGSDVPHVIPISEFRNLFEPRVLLAAPKTPVLRATDGLPAKRFGFRWFVPELLKHKRIWREVLTASLIIQLMALAAPLFTQIVIDKVIVHHTQ
ncbi:MAG: peptidase domain-containing ABC transporter, partial [Pyrinomonadaceae bacterium]